MSTKLRPEITAFKRANARQLRCPECKLWIECQRGRLKLDHHIEAAHPTAWTQREAYKAELLGDAVAPPTAAEPHRSWWLDPEWRGTPVSTLRAAMNEYDHGRLGVAGLRSALLAIATELEAQS